MRVAAETVAEFLFAYTKQYREAYLRAISEPPEGPGFPALPCSPFLAPAVFDVYVTDDGVVINLNSNEPNYQWYIAGGPAFKVDYEPTRTPPEVTKALLAQGAFGKNIGIYRIVAETPMMQSVWRGQILRIVQEVCLSDSAAEISLNLHEVDGPLADVVNAISFGAYGHILNIQLPQPTSQIGVPHLIKNFGIFTADLSGRRFFTHLEIHGQSDAASWDARTVSVRAQHDLRRDLAARLADPTSEGYATLSFGAGPQWTDTYFNRLELLSRAIAALRAALQDHGEEVVAVFHDVLQMHPLLLDVYGTCESKPQFVYPKGTTSPVGKSSLEPDFLITYPDKSYKLVEIERPSKQVATAQGQPRAEVTQTTFQCAEWIHFIRTHYQELSTRFPDIQAKCKTAVVMSRSNQLAFKGIEDIEAYKGLILQQFKIDEFFTFDDLYDRARTAYELLSGLRPSGI